MRRFALALAGLLLLASACVAPDPAWDASRPQATSLLGRPLVPMVLAPDVRAEREALLAEARAAVQRDPGSEAALIWLGRRRAYLGDYLGAIDVFTRALELHPQSHRLRRHRGHRFLTLRRFDEAVADLTTAARLAEAVPDEVEADGLPNERNLPRSTSHSNIFYHLGLAHWLRGEYEPARAAWTRCLDFARNDDMQCATRYWLFLSLSRLGRDDEAREVLAPVRPDMDVIENHDYHRLLLLYAGRVDLAQAFASENDAIGSATAAYGVGMWYLLGGDTERAQTVFRRIVDGPAWPAFGYIAAEAELAG